VRDLLNLFQPVPDELPAALPPADVQPEPAAPAADYEALRYLCALPAADAARPAADAALPTEVTPTWTRRGDELDALKARCADLEEEKEVLRRRCADLETRVEALESEEPWQYFDHDFAERLKDIAERLRALEWWKTD